jgi:hypothetical protein
MFFLFRIYSGKMETETVGHLPFLLSITTEEKMALLVQKSNPGEVMVSILHQFSQLWINLTNPSPVGE